MVRTRAAAPPASADASGRGAGFDLARRFEDSGFFVLRSPLLSFDELVRWSEHGASALGRDELVARLRRAFTRPELREALLFASPELEQRLPAWLDGTSSDPKLDRTLARYYSRAASRSTPFGLFAGIAVGAVGEQDALELGPISSHRRHTRLGMAYLLGRLRELGARDDVVTRLRFEPSSTLYRIAGRIRFATLAADPKIGVTPAYPVVDVEPTPHLEAALSCATGGGTLGEIASALVSSDIVHNPHSSVFSAVDTMANASTVKVLSWYDNEWGYSNRLVDMCRFLERAGL